MSLGPIRPGFRRRENAVSDSYMELRERLFNVNSQADVHCAPGTRKPFSKHLGGIRTKENPVRVLNEAWRASGKGAGRPSEPLGPEAGPARGSVLPGRWTWGRQGPGLHPGPAA